MTHRYTAEYAVTADGDLLPVYLCMQEPENKFGPIVQVKVNQLVAEYGNVVVSCSKSGKFTKDIFDNYLQTVIKPYVPDNKFMFILDSWGGQTDISMLHDAFTDEAGRRTISVEIIPPLCTPLCQPCDVDFFRQVKLFIKKLQNCTELLKENRQIHSREDAIKINSLVHHQLGSPVFRDMIRYAWFKSHLISDNPFFRNVKEVCFPDKVSTEKCLCEKVAFVICARCTLPLCFHCFYDDYHPQSCSPALQ